MKKGKILSLVFFLIFLAISAFIFLGDLGSREVLVSIAGESGPPEPETGETDEKSAFPESESGAMIYVHVCGCVKNPGVYSLESGARVFEALQAAGGVTEDGREDVLNLAGILSDGDRIYLPSEDELDCSQAEEHQGHWAGFGGKVNINSADISALMTLPGIGEKKAADIISYREREGGFAACEDIKKVSGIGEATYSRIEALISVR